MNLGKNIIQLREKAGLSQAEFARLLKVPQPNITRWESGAITPSIESIIKIAKALGVSIDEILLTENEREKLEPSNHALLKRFKSIEKLPNKDKETLIQLTPS